MAKRLGLISILALAAVCGTPVSPCACEPQKTHLIVYGAVQTTAGAPVAGARVLAVALPEGATGYDPALATADAVDTTDSQGLYRVHLLSFLAPAGPAEVRLAVVHAPADTVRVDAVGASLRNQREPADSLRVDVTMP